MDNLGSSKARIARDDGASKAIEITPIEVGEETVSISVQFEDGGFDERFFHLRSLPNASGLREFNLHFANYPIGYTHLVAFLRYSQLSSEVITQNLSDFDLQVDQPADPVIRLDRDGTIHELRPGTAVVSTSFAGLRKAVTIQVASAPPK